MLAYIIYIYDKTLSNPEQILSYTNNIASLISEIKVDCITINTQPVKSAIDDHIQLLFEALLSSLRFRIHEHVSTIDDFLKTSIAMLGQRPQTVEEIGQANSKHGEFAVNKSQVTLTRGSRNHSTHHLYNINYTIISVIVIISYHNNYKHFQKFWFIYNYVKIKIIIIIYL